MLSTCREQLLLRSLSPASHFSRSVPLRLIPLVEKLDAVQRLLGAGRSWHSGRLVAAAVIYGDDMLSRLGPTEAAMSLTGEGEFRLEE